MTGWLASLNLRKPYTRRNLSHQITSCDATSDPPKHQHSIFFFLLKATTQLARQVHQERTQVVCSNKVGQNRLAFLKPVSYLYHKTVRVNEKGQAETHERFGSSKKWTPTNKKKLKKAKLHMDTYTRTYTEEHTPSIAPSQEI